MASETADSIASRCAGDVTLATMRYSASALNFRRSKRTISSAFLSSAARAAATAGDLKPWDIGLRLQAVPESLFHPGADVLQNDRDESARGGQGPADLGL